MSVTNKRKPDAREPATIARPRLAMKDPLVPENELCWYRLRVKFLRQPTAAEMVAEARDSDRNEARAAVAALRNHLAAGTPPPPALAEFMVEALTKIAQGEDANLALGVKVGNAPKDSRFYHRKAAYGVLYLVSRGAPVEAASESIYEFIKAHVDATKARARGKPVDLVNLGTMEDEEISFWSTQALSEAYMLKRYREHKQTMLEILHSIQ